MEQKMTRKKTKQLCAVLLAVVMTMAMLPLTVFATESPVVVKDANGNQDVSNEQLWEFCKVFTILIFDLDY